MPPEPTDISIYPIVQVGTPVLRKRARPLTVDEIRSSKVQSLIQDMRATMYDAPGVGLAAPQIGLDLQIAVLEDRAENLEGMEPGEIAEKERAVVPFTVIVNPTLTVLDETPCAFFEGCLSVSGWVMMVERPRRVRVEALDETGTPRVIEASGWHARILQHEIDHLFGTLCVDRMDSRTLATGDQFTRYWAHRSVAEARAALALAEPPVPPLPRTK